MREGYRRLTETTEEERAQDIWQDGMAPDGWLQYYVMLFNPPAELCTVCRYRFTSELTPSQYAAHEKTWMHQTAVRLLCNK